MPRYSNRFCLIAILAACPTTASAAASAEERAFFDREIKPILTAHCFSCHGGEKRIRADLNLTTRAGLLKGGESGPAVNLVKPGESLLVAAINYTDLRMPPRGQLPKAQIELLTKWVHMGAPYSEERVVRHGPPKVDAHAKAWWSFQPLRRPSIPEVKKPDWVRNPIDAFILAKLESAGLTPSPPADKVALLRRVTYDLTGLPPTPAEVKAFRADASPDAYGKAVERLLDSPPYGERWARHWLDLVRYAETDSFERDGAKPFVWRYRDWVIRSFNQDKPYDQFIREQLAGDELDEATADGVIATGYYRLGPWDDEPVDRVQAYYDGLDDIVTTTGQVFLGLTINCARCHDHKIDPLPQKDYYRFLSFFHGIRHYGERSRESVFAASVRPVVLPEEAAVEQEKVAAHKRRVADVEAKIAGIEKSVAPKLQGGEKDDFAFPQNRFNILKKHVGALINPKEFDRYKTLRKELEQLEKNPPSGLSLALCVTEKRSQPEPAFVLARGNPAAKGAQVTPGFPSVLTDYEPPLPTPAKDARTSGRRRVLAEWIASKDNALTWRVIANRLWHYHFGRGIVRSTSDFGFQGLPPTHPELLDWLASEFIQPSSNPGDAMRFKAMHRLIVLSNTYRMSSHPSPLGGGGQGVRGEATDASNDLFWRFDPRRLSAEEIRDSILAVSGNLNMKMFGPSIYPKIPKEVLAGQSQPGLGWPTSPPEEAARRSVYVHIKRSLALPILAAFDAADTDGSCPVRFTTTQPTQALGMLNGEFLNEQATLFAANVRKHAGDDPAGQVQTILWRTRQREPAAVEVQRGVELMRDLESEGISRPEALRLYCLLALNLNEFVFVD